MPKLDISNTHLLNRKCISKICGFGLGNVMFITFPVGERPEFGIKRVEQIQPHISLLLLQQQEVGVAKY